MNVVTVIYVVPLALVVDGVPHPSGRDVAWGLAYGVAMSVALLAAFQALTIGPVGLVAPVISTEGAIAAVGGVLLGDHVAGTTGAALAVCVIGVVLSGLQVSQAGHADRRAFTWAVAGAFLFGATLLASSRAVGLGPVTTVAVGRAVACVVFSAPVLAQARFTRPVGVWRLVFANGMLDLVGFSAFVAASRHGVAVPAVLGSQYAALTVVVGFVAFRERLGRVQWIGIALTIVGTAVVAATSTAG